MLTRAMLKHRKAEMEILQLALYDPLTGLANRRLFNEKLTQRADQAMYEAKQSGRNCYQFSKQ